MSLRISAILLAVLSPLVQSAAQDGSDIHPTSREAQRRMLWAQGVLVGDPTGSGPGFVFDHPPGNIGLDLMRVFEQWTNGVFLAAPPGQMFKFAAPGVPSRGSDSTVDTREFPFSPRPLHQFNYGTGIRSAAQNLGDFNNSPAVMRDGNTIDDDTSLPIIIPASGTLDDGISVVEHADAASCTGACGRCLNSDECPIDVVMAEDGGEADCGEPAPIGVFTPPLDTLVFQIAPGNLLAEMPSTTTTGETCSHSEPPLKAKVEHLLEAAKHLAGAGYEEEAKLFRVEAEAIQKASTRLLTEKRQELERLQREITELEELTGQYTMIQLNCRIMEVTLAESCAADPRLQTLTKSGYCILSNRAHAGACESTAGCGCGNTAAELLQALDEQACATVKTIAAPTLITTNGRTAQLHNGGEFPVLIPASATAESPATAETRIEWVDFGVTLQAVPFVLGDGKLRLSLDAEVSERDYSQATHVAGGVIPGLTTRRSRTDIEAQFGDTVVLRCCTSATKSGEKTLLLLVTAEQVEPLPEPPHHD